VRLSVRACTVESARLLDPRDIVSAILFDNGVIVRRSLSQCRRAYEKNRKGEVDACSKSKKQ